ncbi:MBOAT family O-acyltransferase [Stieleria varia]|uniref:Peptidoglycan O-acetyltransferase n=1 Tax=Stieleria varia TaxID=2528005 RepID=A0A5C6A1V9_9BACT|nr:MBOAT family protein [Stieleria varia]TWT93218.1 Peptidoglycan O-acetyltransferase [Stieleria varia]
MQFTQLEFLIFFVVVLAVAWAARSLQLRSVRMRNVWLLAASYYFYAYWDYRFCGLLVLSTVVDFVVAKWLVATESPTRRRVLLGISVAVNLGVLGFFKYCNFFIESAQPLMEFMGLNASTLNIILPVGISFYTFQTLSYTIDVYRGNLRPTDRLVDFALFVAFFPQLVAGPIVRAKELLPQLARTPKWSGRRFYGGSQQLLRGAVKKVLLADRLGEAVDVVFAAPDLYSSATVWIAVFAYAGQIYYDFSGYSDMAIGAAKMLGYRFPVNFRHPYLAQSMTEFWHRWHMTLSRWLRDYLYISLGGNRSGSLMTYRNLMVTMVLGGLWHGAAWTFVLWGVLHGIALSVERRFAGRKPSRPSRLRQIAGWCVTLCVVLLGWILFRSPDLTSAMQVVAQLFAFDGGIAWYPPLVLLALGCMVAEHVAWRTRLRLAMRLPITAWYSPVATTVMIWALVLYFPREFRPFVYFQF